MSSRQNLDMNIISLSDTMDCGILCRQTMSLKKAWGIVSTVYGWARGDEVAVLAQVINNCEDGARWRCLDL